MKKFWQKFTEPTRAKTAVAAALCALLVVYCVYMVIHQLNSVSALKAQMSSLGGGTLGALGGLLGNLIHIEIPTQLYFSIGLNVAANAVLALIFLKLLLPTPKHRYILIGMLALYFIILIWQMAETQALSKTGSIVLMIFQPDKIRPWTIFYTFCTGYMAFFLCTIVSSFTKLRLEWFAALVALAWLGYAIVSTLRGEIQNMQTFVLGVLAQAAFAAVLLLAPACRLPLIKRRYYDDDYYE
ncbi:MAG: hypothetical protein LBG83_03920 [Oscillospiraceae bacterium]|jgi:hypothetical protein|nr:hypothetical protein [Oscillospiraceae bacterium]